MEADDEGEADEEEDLARSGGGATPAGHARAATYIAHGKPGTGHQRGPVTGASSLQRAVKEHGDAAEQEESAWRG